MTIEFLANEEGPGITVVDRIEGRRFPLSTPQPVTLEVGTSNPFREPVDATVSGLVEELELPHVIGVFVRDETGEMIAECHDFARENLSAGEYELEIAAPIKIFLRVSGPITITSTSVEMRITFTGSESVTFGARSYHERPAATVTSTADPEDLMAAVSTFGSALQTTSPERSFPSLRGYPPSIELGDELAIPDAVEPPETGLRIDVPRDRGTVYSVATLAHYLGACVTPGDEACLLAGDDVVRDLEGPDGLRETVSETLQQIFLLDCIVRTEGRYQLDLHERRQLEERVDLPLQDLYNAPIAERTTRYLDVPAEMVSDLVPTWSLSMHLSPAPQSAELLSYAANALSLISVEHPTTATVDPSPPPGYHEFVRSMGVEHESFESSIEAQYITVSESDALEQAWVGTERSVNANDLHPAGVRNRLTREAVDSPIDISLVCNDEQMADEVGDGGLYGDREELPFEVTIHHELSCDELQAILETDTNFLHYVGHVERAGLICHDGALDARELDNVGVETFLLNGCRSYDQGAGLVKNGSVGGVVTHGAVDNSNATTVGQIIAGLLNGGYPLRSALSVTAHHLPIEGHYTVIGDGAVQVAQSEGGTPTLLNIARDSENLEYDVRIETHPTLGQAMGACYTPHIASEDRYFLTGGELPSINLSLPEVVNLMALERVPAVVDEKFRWSTAVTPDELP